MTTPRQSRPSEQFDVTGAAVAAAIEAFFGAMWFSWGQADEGLPGWLTWLDTAGSLICVLVLVAAAVTVWRHRARPAAMSDPAVRRHYNRIVAVELASIALGALVLGVVGAGEFIAAWVAAGVGVHFFPLAALFRTRQLQVLGAAVTLVAVAALAVGLAGETLPSTVAGPGAGVCLLAGALAALLSVRGAGRIS